MRDDAENGQLEGKAIDDAEQDLEADDEIYESRKKFFGKHCMFFD
jgi:hypothetical protein